MANVKKKHFSMRGIEINMEELRMKNEDAIAVTGKDSGLNMNARGDIVRHGAVVKRREKIEQEYNTLPQGAARTVAFKGVEADTFLTPTESWSKATAPVEQPKVEAKVEDTPPVVEEKTRTRKFIEKED